MCLILLAWQAHPEYPLIVAANRDEFFERPTASAQFWPENPALLAGRDLLAGGTWLGITRNGRFAALTNYREIRDRSSSSPPPALSRGRLVSDFLQDDIDAPAYLAALAARADDYQAFNLICGSLAGGLWYYSNRDRNENGENGGLAAGQPGKALGPGIYGLSNNLLDAPWPKVTQGKSALAQALDTLPEETALFELLRDDHTHADDQLPRTGISLEWERALSAAFIRAPQMPHYGTRSSTVLLCDRQQNVSFDEQSYRPDGSPPAADQRSRFRFRLDA